MFAIPTRRKYREKTVEAALNKGFRVALATNPVFPRVAIEERMRWAGIDGLPFDLVSTYEDFHYCKPSRGYYEELLERLEVRADQCVMVGNDMQEDMMAGALGMKTYWVTDQSINREDGQTYEPDARGSLENLLKMIENEDGLFAERAIKKP